MTAVSGANANKNIDWSQVLKTGSNGISQITGDSRIDKYSTYAGNVLNGNYTDLASSGAHDLTNAFIKDGKTANVVNGIADMAISVWKCVADVKSGNYQMGADKAESKKDLGTVNANAAKTKSLSTNAESQANGISAQVKANLDGIQQQMQQLYEQQMSELMNHIQLKQDMFAQNEELQTQVDQNQDETQQKQDEMADIKEKIDEQSKSSPSPTNNGTPPASAPKKAATNPIQKNTKPGSTNPTQPKGANGNSDPNNVNNTNDKGNNNETSTFTPLEQTGNGVDPSLVARYNQLGNEVAQTNDDTQNLSATIVDNNTQVATSAETTAATVETTTSGLQQGSEDMQNVTQQGQTDITNTGTSLTSNTQPLTTSMQTSSVKEGVMSGVNKGESTALKVAAATAATESVVTMGASAGDAEELTAASVDKDVAAGTRVTDKTQMDTSMLAATIFENSVKVVISTLPQSAQQNYNSAMSIMNQFGSELAQVQSEADLNTNNTDTNNNTNNNTTTNPLKTEKPDIALA